MLVVLFFFFSSRRRHTRLQGDWSSDVCSSDLALQEAERRGVTVLLTTDHGSIHCETPATVYAKRDATANLRYKFGEDLRTEDQEAAIVVEDLKAFGLPGMALGVRLLLATSDRFFVYPTKLREYQARYP